MATETDLPDEVAAALAQLDHLVRRMEEHPEPAVRDHVMALLQCVDVVHRAGLRRLGDLLKVAGLQRRALDDPEVRLLFDLYDLGEGGERQRAEAVLASVRPYAQSHGGDLEVVEAEAGVVSVRLQGAGQGCGGAVAPLRQVVEETLRQDLPGFVRLEVLDPPLTSPAPNPDTTFIPLAVLAGRPRLAWHDALYADDLPQGGLRVVDLAADQAVLVARVGDEVVAYRDACPGSPLPLRGGRLADGELRCPWHGCRFDLRSGERLDAVGAGLERVPLSVDDRGMVQVGVLGRAA